MDWTNYFAQILQKIAEKSKDETKFAALIVNRSMAIVSSGFNGLPRGVDEYPNRMTRPQKYEWTVHAEDNALLNAARHGIAVENCTMFVIEPPCARCASHIIQAGLKEVVHINEATMPQDHRPWTKTVDEAYEMFREAGVLVRRGY